MFAVTSWCRKFGAASAMAWTLIAGATAQAAPICSLGIMANLPVTMRGLRASVPVKINGKDTSFWLDSGAFFSIMSAAKAAELDLKVGAAPPGFYLVGIGGTASAGVTTVKSFGIVGQNITNIQFLVGGSDAGNGLIGRNLLGLADTEFDLANGSVKLIHPKDCDGPLAYWAGTKPYFVVPLNSGENPNDHQFRLPVTINGAKVEAVLDTGAPTSLISRRAAERAGIDLSGPGVTPEERIGGFGRSTKSGWVVPVASVGIGDEQILKTHLSVIDGDIVQGNGAPDMLLGADFVLAHHLYVARAQHRIYFTYSGGRPFITSSEPASVVSDASPAAIPEGTRRVEAVSNAGADPKTADDFARRGSARLAQRAFAGAIADLTKAIDMAPGTAGYFRDRAKAYGASGQASAARADMARALEIDPNDAELLTVRGFMRLRDKDRAGALVDAEAASRLTPPTSLDMSQLAFLFERLGQPARAIALYDGVIAVHHEDSRLGELLNGRCWVRALANTELDKALDDCNRAIKRGGAKAAFLDSRGLVFFRRGDLAAALADYDAAIQLEPRQAWSLYMRGLTRIRLGQAEAGAADKATAANIQPDIAGDVASYGLSS
ncbi:retroviral-like aspartic protease family protein [Novosphingobium sp. G106]|nr:retroviral-like aspartic protease family protein [Novosphingobium sp. G106]